MTRCFWCLAETTTDKDSISQDIKLAVKEHIFPESVGGKRTLPLGSVCKECNESLGATVDRYLKKGNFMMMHVSQSVRGTPGKKRGRKDRERKEQEKKEIQRYNGGTTVAREGIKITFKNLPSGSAGDFTHDEFFSLALHKCVANVLCDVEGPDYVISNHRELCNFVQSPTKTDHLHWSYAVRYSNPLVSQSMIFEPSQLSVFYGILSGDKKERIVACALAFPAGIYILGTLPNVLNRHILPGLVRSVEENTGNIKMKLHDYSIGFHEYFSPAMFGARSNWLGEKLPFTWIKKEIEGTLLNPPIGYRVLVECTLCGQTTPTRINLSKELVLKGDYTNTITSCKNSWNRTSVEDLRYGPMNTDTWEPKKLQEYIDRQQGICYPKENDVKKMKISNCKTQCINCDAEIVYDAKDCFI